jgi:hypothetical protein
MSMTQMRASGSRRSCEEDWSTQSSAARGIVGNIMIGTAAGRQRYGHYQSGCLFPAHCSVCDIDEHTTGMCPKACKQLAL